MKKEVISSENEIRNKEILVNVYYNSDSSYYVSRNIEKETNGLPLTFFLIKTENIDTVFVSKKVYEFRRWEGNELLVLRKRTGILNKENRYNLNEESTSNYYLNINNLKITITPSTLK